MWHWCTVLLWSGRILQYETLSPPSYLLLHILPVLLLKYNQYRVGKTVSKIKSLTKNAETLLQRNSIQWDRRAMKLNSVKLSESWVDTTLVLLDALCDGNALKMFSMKDFRWRYWGSFSYLQIKTALRIDMNNLTWFTHCPGRIYLHIKKRQT